MDGAEKVGPMGDNGEIQLVVPCSLGCQQDLLTIEGWGPVRLILPGPILPCTSTGWGRVTESPRVPRCLGAQSRGGAVVPRHGSGPLTTL